MTRYESPNENYCPADNFNTGIIKEFFNVATVSLKNSYYACIKNYLLGNNFRYETKLPAWYLNSK